jgi:hypothetical protein
MQDKTCFLGVDLLADTIFGQDIEQQEEVAAPVVAAQSTLPEEAILVIVCQEKPIEIP